MTPEQRAALLHQVQLALDGAGIGRHNYGSHLPTLSISGDRQIVFFTDFITVTTNDLWADRLEDVATFTFDELFPPLVWELKDEMQEDERQEVKVEKITLAIPKFLDPDTLKLDDEDGNVFYLDLSEDLAKEAAQSLADILAKADRARRAGVQ